MNRIFASFFVLGLVLSSAQVSFAQESEPAQPAVPSPQAVGPLNCYDFYTYGSVEADLKPTVKQTVPGTPITFVGNLKNTNPYPLLDGTLYVKIFKRDETTFSAGDVDFVVDQFVIKDGITLRANGQERTTFVWEVPRNAEAGNYYAAYFFTTAKRYNLMGLSFTDDIVGNQAPFAITAPDAVPVAKLLKSDTTLNGETNLFAGYPLSFSADEAVTISTTLINNSAVAKTLPLQWNQYAWDSMNKDNLRRTKTEVVTIPPKSEKTVTYTAQKQSESVVYVTAVTQDIETKSFLNVRYGHDGIPETRTNFLGLSAFPLAKDTPATLFACAQSTNLPLVPGNILTLSLKDRAGKTIHEYRYEGDIKGTTGGFGESFTPASNINFATLTATLERDGVVIEEVTQTYDCEAIDPVTCFPEEGMGGFLDFLKTYYLPLILTLVIILLIAAIMVYLKKRPRREHIDAGTSNTAFLFLLLFLPSLFFFNSDAVNAQACMVGSQHNIDFLGVDGEGNNGGETGIQGDARCQVRTYVEEGSYVACDYEQRPYTVSPVGRCLSGVRFLPSPQDAAQCYIQGFDCADVGSCGGSGDTEFWGGGFNSSDCSPMFVTCQPGQRAYFDTRETERQCPGFVGRSHIGIIGRCIADASCTASSGNLCTATPQETYIAGQCNDWGYTQLISKYQGNDGYQLWENATDQGTNTGECVQIKPAQVGNEVLSAWKASSCTAPTSCGPIGYQAYTAEEFRNLSLQCQAEGFTVLSESANEPEGGQLADLGKTQGCLVTRDLNPDGPFGGGYQYAWYTNPSASCTAPPTGGSCTWTRKFQDAFDGWVTDVYARCQSRFQFFASTKPLCSSVGVIEGASATGSESNCLPYTSGNDACGEFTNIQSYEFDQLAPAGPGCVAQTSCTQEFNSARWYTGGTSVPISSEGLSQPNNCARDAQDQGYTHWNRSVRHDSTQEDPYVTNCFGVSNPTGTESKLQVVTYRDGATITITTGFDSGSSCTASPTNRAPNAPTINGQGNGGSTNGVVNLDVNLAFLATDPDSDNILYGIDWDNTGEDPDQWLPGDRTLVPSGTVLSTNRSYLSDGTYTFRALAVDSNGNRSGWTSHTVNVGSPITQCSYDIVSNCVEGRCNDLHTVRTSFGSGQAETIDVWDQFTIEAIVGGVRQTLVTRCDAEFPGFGNCMATQSFTINGHALSVDVLASFTPSGINSSEMRGTGDVQNCTYQGISADLKINDSTGPLTVTRGTPLAIEWSSANAASCSAFWQPGAPTVDPSGTDSQSASMSMDYMINCGGALASVTVTIVNAPPNAPAITHPTGSADFNANTTFSIQGSDPDGDNVFYEVDWNPNDSIDFDTNTSDGPNNSIQTASHAFSTAGRNTIRARTVDTSGATSGWTTYDININQAPAPVATLEVAVNGGSFSTGDQTVNPGDTISIRWDSSNASSCAGSGSGFDTGGRTNGTDGVNTPAPNSQTTFTATCTGPGGERGTSLTITVRQLPNLSQPNITYQLSTGFDLATGAYNYVDIFFNTSNNGGSDTRASADYRFEFDSGRNGYELTRTGSLGLFTVGQTVPRTERVQGPIIFGDSRVRVTVDSTDVVTETDETDNDRSVDITFVPPDPELSITADRTQLREGEATRIRWSRRASYPLDCTVSGPNMLVENAAQNDERPTAPIMAKSVFTFTCIEPITGTEFSTSVSVESAGTIEET